MTQVLTLTLREFQRNAGKYLGQEIVLTKYNLPVARVTPEPREKNSKNFSEAPLKETPSELFSPLCSLAMCRKPATKKNKLGEWRCEEHL